MKYLHCFLLSMSVIFCSDLSADINTFQASDDAYVDSVDIGGNFNTDKLQIHGYSGSGIPNGVVVNSVQQSFLKFDVSTLTDMTILSATFRVYLDEWYELFAPSMQLTYVEDDSWSETTLNWTNKPAGTTPIGASVAIGDVGYYEWILYQKDTLFTDWYDDHLAGDGFASYMLTVNDETATSYAHFSSDEAGVNPPELIIEYIPEPTTLILLSLGTALLHIRRRR